MNPLQDNTPTKSSFSNPGAEGFEDAQNIHETFILGLNNDLLTTGTSYAEQAFGVGCGASLVPIGFILLISFIVGARNWIMLAIIGLTCALIATAAAAFFSSRSRNNAIQRVFREQTQPAIQKYLQDHSLSLNSFDAFVTTLLPLSAPLRQSLIASQKENQTTEER
jgi:glucan phosphoethanolaminetransferase (alkaline phosphatase superfamily)